MREDLADYFGEVQAFDAALGVLLEKLKAIGELDNTLIVVSGDHGPPGFPRGKCNLYDFGTEVPLVVHGPGVKAGRVVDDLVSLTDLAPTFLEVAGVPIPETMTGKSLVSVLQAEGSGQIDPARHRGLHRPRAARRFRPRGFLALSPEGDPHTEVSVHPQLPSRAVAHGRPVPAR